MKYAAALLILLSSASAFAAEEKKCAAPQAVAIVDGMVCDFCAQSLKKVFMKDPNVESVDINLTTKEVKVVMKEGTDITDAAINKNVDWAGYKVSGITRSCAKSG